MAIRSHGHLGKVRHVLAAVQAIYTAEAKANFQSSKHNYPKPSEFELPPARYDIMSHILACLTTATASVLDQPPLVEKCWVMRNVEQFFIHNVRSPPGLLRSGANVARRTRATH
ncbi:hypothetical protein LshimejAT787_1302220 [Lyophyllum shimeji]|uniref:Uncharacterized protein n=1 Tax=Lyophyllum shimeji TaxID=47721 RepID=A0A9P3PY72_LYOSH|nr:hypothetical protein LshimejAT787_1302220 [Lyophyllum shimeji]